MLGVCPVIPSAAPVGQQEDVETVAGQKTLQFVFGVAHLRAEDVLVAVAQFLVKDIDAVVKPDGGHGVRSLLPRRGVMSVKIVS